MTRRRWIADEVAGDSAALVGEHASHLVRVLRAEVGQEFDIAVGNDAIRVGTITAISDRRVEFTLGERQAIKAVPRVTLVLSIFKFDRMEWAIEKCTEIGVARIIPLIARRTDAHLAAAAAKRRERWQRLVRQAAEQSRGAMIPEIAAPVKLQELHGTGGVLDVALTRVFLAEPLAGPGERPRLGEILPSRLTGVALAVGPEGGWAEAELSWFLDAGWVAASLGETILRAETAAIVGCALTLDAIR